MQLSEIISSLSIKKQEKLPTHCGQSTAGVFFCWGFAPDIFWLDFDKFNRLWVTTYAGLECFEEINGLWKNTMTYTSRTPAPCNLSTDLLHNIYSDTTKNELIITSAMGINRVIFDNEGKVVRIVKYLARTV